MPFNRSTKNLLKKGWKGGKQGRVEHKHPPIVSSSEYFSACFHLSEDATKKAATKPSRGKELCTAA